MDKNLESLLPGFPWEKYEKSNGKKGRISLKKRKRFADDKNENNLWRVKCGTKMGILHKEKMSKGEACIERKGSFYTPPEFEKLAGKEPCRKWKSSICHKGKTLRFWFKKGYLTTNGYRQKKRKQQSSDLESHELSTEPKEDRDEDEDDDGEEDDDDMDEDNEPDTKKNKDEDATPIYISSEEEESEKDLVEDEDEDMDEDDVGDDQRSTEEDEDEEDDNDEEETVPAVASNNTDSKERVTATIPTPGKHALEMKEKTRRRPDMPRSEVSGNKRDVAKNTAIKLQNVKKEPQDKLKKTTSSTISTPVKPALKIKEVKGVANSLPEKTRHHSEMARSEVRGHNRDVATNTAIKLQNVKKEPEDKLSPSCEPLAVSDQQEHKAVHCSGHKVADLQSMRPEGGADITEARLPGPSASSGLNTMDLDQLKREKIKNATENFKITRELLHFESKRT
ncbi:histone deacetylase HDT1 isoform X2 [Oreochromis niloticus]|uniref:histone deacetylase HDT1 isoform X2 n=1 Tax=Oreochromis niloticus TaxID=8128 RepID=UPI000904D531|nr:histone deacetylase HDT1 isoform X2 [Oreochromis niloticus]